MGIVFVDEGESNRAIIAVTIYNHIYKKRKGKGLLKARVATTGKNKSLHMKGLKALKEFGLKVAPCFRKDVTEIEKINFTGKTRFVILGYDNDNGKIKDIVKKKCKSVECWAIDNPIKECKNEVKLRFFRRVRDQLWVNIENLVSEI